MDFLTCAAIIRDEFDLPEWIAYYRVLGVDKFLLYDNHSQVPVRETLAEYIDRGFVHVEEVEGEKRQMEAYRRAIEATRGVSKWCLFVDCDEFVLPLKDPDLPSLISRYGDAGSIAWNWLIFGSSGREKRHSDKSLCIENYLRRGDETFGPNKHVKSCVDPLQVADTFSPHCFRLKEGSRAVNSIGETMTFAEGLTGTSLCAPSYEIAQVNHYFCKSPEDWVNKRRRGEAYSKIIKPPQMWANYDEHCNKVLDVEILRHAGAVRDFLGM